MMFNLEMRQHFLGVRKSGFRLDFDLSQFFCCSHGNPLIQLIMVQIKKAYFLSGEMGI